MITGATKNKVDDIWQRMWEGGVTNPIEVIMKPRTWKCWG